MEKMYKVVEITFINEDGERITCNLETGEVTPKTLDCFQKGKALLHTGAFIAGGNIAMKKYFDAVQ